jgi:transposase
LPSATTDKDFERFYTKLCAFRDAHELETAVIGFESTGGWGVPLIHFLRTKQVRLVQVNPMHAKRVKKLSGNSPNKTDRKDPRVIADIMMLGHAPSVVVPSGAAAELRGLVHARERARARRTVVCNQLHALVYVIFPELLMILKHVHSASVISVLRNHPTPEEIRALGKERLVKLLRTASRGRYGEERAHALWEAARRSVGIREGIESILMEIQYLLDQIDQANTFIHHLEKRMEVSLSQVPSSTHLLSMKGVGIVIAAGLIGEIGDFNGYRNAAEIIKFAGLNLYEISSGIHKGKRRITKRGRPLVRKLLYLAAMNMVRTGGIFHGAYQRMIHRGTPPVRALIAISRKLLRVAFAMVRDQKNYTPFTMQQAA